MESFFSRFKSALVLVAVLLAQVIGLASQLKRPDYRGRADGHNVRFARAWSAYTITPLELLLKRTGGGVRSMWHGYIDLRHVRQHDRDLQYQIDQLRLREAALAEDARQGQRLQHLLQFKQGYVGKTVAAQVVGTGGTDGGRVITIDKGSANGVQPDMAVITPDGVVGKIRDVFAMSAQVLLLNDAGSGAGVVLERTRTRGVLRGTANGSLQISNLLPDERIKPGEAVLTSGGDRVFPRGLPIGYVVSSRPDPEHQPYAAITVRPAANLDRLEEVLVVTNVLEQLASSTATEPAAGEGKPETAGDKLPGLKPPATEAKPGEAAPAVPSAPTLPRPPAALRTDRYSPGAVPPAGSLQPGARDMPLQSPAPRPAPPARTTETP